MKIDADKLRAQVAFARENFRRDGGEGETVHALADAAEILLAPELDHFASAVVREAAHQRARWGSDHDGGKAPADWFWLLGYLAGKALRAATVGDVKKAMHHTISSAAALANWHAALAGASTQMRPGIAAPAGEAAER